MGIRNKEVIKTTERSLKNIDRLEKRKIRRTDRRSDQSWNRGESPNKKCISSEGKKMANVSIIEAHFRTKISPFYRTLITKKVINLMSMSVETMSEFFEMSVGNQNVLSPISDRKSLLLPFLDLSLID